ncbi:autotransporter outer membrane beta-barrel domain-containing protein [Candidatus Odyssella thessalonicensis]|uniref:autotransporter outer membrane beta-barrel domain-containing protein n=1 Tax=Candidatus Odyssella thessalonicensis TaxID=84647 RepID=UPI000225AEBA|nr:autotransporter outer membrane beta-barrel domain-containing protein [Candidatus Odyssella thessalonicensis]
MTGDILNNAALIFSRSDVVTYGGAITGTGSLEKQGAGTLTLTGANTHSGGTTLTTGTLQIGNGGTMGSVAGNITNNAALRFNRSDDLVYSNVISGSGTVEKQGAGKITIDAAQTYTGATTITAGTLQVGNGGTTGSLAGDIINNAAVIFDRSNALTYGGNMSGTGSLEKQGAGTLTLTGASTHSGGTTISAGTLEIGNGGTTGSVAGNMVNAATVIFNRADDLSYSNVISGTGSLEKQGSGKLTINGAQTYSGGTTLTNGTVRITHQQGVGTGTIIFAGVGTTLEIGSALTDPIANAITVNANSNLDTQGYDVTLSGTITGTSTLRKLGSGVLTLASANAFNGIILDGDTVALANDQGLGSGALSFNNAGTKLVIAANLTNVANPIAVTANGIIDTNGNMANLTGALSGNATLEKQGVGLLQISSVSPGYSGTLIANADELKINGSLPNATVTVANVARFTGNATVNNLTNSGIVKPGNSIGIIQVLSNFDNSNGTYACEINDASQSDLIQVTGTATLGGTLNILPQAGNYITPKTYTILTAGNPIATQFNAVTTSSAMLKYTLNYLANSVQLTAVQAFTLNEVATDGNPGIVADYIFRQKPPASSQLGELIRIFPTLSLSELYEALNQLQPSANVLLGATIGKSELGQVDELFSSFATEDTLKRLRNTKKKSTASKQIAQMISRLAMPMTQSLNSLYASKSADSYASQHTLLSQGQEAPQHMKVAYGNTTVWLKQTAVESKRHAVPDGSPTIGTPGVKSKLSTTTIGSTIKVLENLLLGGSLGYTKRWYHLQRNYGHGQINSYSLGLHGQWRPQASWYIKAAGFYGHHAFEGVRHLQLSSAIYANNQHHKGEHVSGAVEGGHDIELTPAMTVTGYGGLSGLFLKENNYREISQGLNPALKVAGRTSRVVQSKIGAQVSYAMLWRNLPIYLQGTLAYIYRRHLGNPQQVRASMSDYEDTFTVKVNDKQQRILKTGIGIAAALTEDLSLSLNYNNEWSSSERLNRLLLEFNYRF